jgi:ketosteroid isomerase-like protein
MLGHWVRVDGTGSETWVAVGPTLFGVGFSAMSPGRTWFEALSISDVDGVLTYTAIPGGQQAVDFGLAETESETILFTNPAHDHPQRIRYQRRGDTLVAEIESTHGGHQQWFWQRAELASTTVLEEVDRQFAAESAGQGAEVWAKMFAADGVTWQRGRPPVTGADAIRESMQRVLSNPEIQLAWEPDAGALSPTGDMGFTVGRYQLLRRGRASPAVQMETGTYLTIWRRYADSSWQAVFGTRVPDSPHAHEHQ